MDTTSSTTPKQVVIFGLAADPIHLGHTALLEELAKHRDEVWVLPCYSHLFEKDMAPPDARYEMCRLAIQDIPNVELGPMDPVRESTYENLCRLTKLYGDIEFSFALGQDNANAIDKWKFGDRLISEFTLIVVPRLGSETQVEQLNDKWYYHEPHLFLPDFKPLNISSTDIRQSVETHKEFLHPRVYEYIKAHNLYEE